MNKHLFVKRALGSRVVAVLVVSSLALAACSSGGSAGETAKVSASASSEASSSSSASAESSGSSSSDAEALPGYAPGVFPEVPAIVIPDVSLLTKSAPTFSVSLEERFSKLKGVKVTGAQCDAGGKLTTSSVNESLFSDASKTVTNDGKGAGTYSDAEVTIVNNGDGSGSFSSASVTITVDGEGGGTFSDAGLTVTVDGKGKGSYSSASQTITNEGDGSGTYSDASMTITNKGDGSGSYSDAKVTITNDGKGTANISTASGTYTVEAKPLVKLAPVGKFPTLAALTPDNICGVLVTVESEVLFDFGKSEVRSDAESTLSDVASALNEVKAPKVEVIGHTDSVDSDEFNQKLSEERAKAVVEVLKGGGATAELVATGKGESQPVAPNTNADGSDNPSGRQLNRRVEIFIPKF